MVYGVCKRGEGCSAGVGVRDAGVRSTGYGVQGCGVRMQATVRGAGAWVCEGMGMRGVGCGVWGV